MAGYFLGEMSDDEQTQFETRYLADDALFDQMLLVKKELIDAYVRHHLDAETREKFERHFLSTPEGQQEVAFASALREKLNPPAQPIMEKARGFKLSDWLGAWSFRELALAGVSVLLFVGGAWSLNQNRKLSAELTGLQNKYAEQARNNTELQQQLAELRSPNPSPIAAPSPDDSAKLYDFLAINLSGTDRSPGSETKVKLPNGDYRARLNVRLGFKPVGLRCNVTLKTPDGATFESHSLRARQHPDGYYLRADFPMTKLKAGDYEVIVSGRDADDNSQIDAPYHFRLEPLPKR